MTLQLFAGTNLILGWAWFDSHLEPHKPEEMSTRHLFNTLKMIWNNSVPEEMRVKPIRLYNFPNHTPTYMKQAVVHIGQELFTRNDISPYQMATLLQMQSWFQKEPKLLQ